MARKAKQSDLAEKVKKIIIYLQDSENWTQAEIANSIGTQQPIVSLLKKGKISSESKNFEKWSKNLQGLITEESVLEEVDAKALRVEESENYAEWFTNIILSHEISLTELADRTGLTYQGLYRIYNGDTVNPQKATREKIRKALETWVGLKEFAQAPAENQSDIVVNIPFTEADIDQAPALIGVYAIHDRRGYPTYVGKGRIKNRLKKHREHRAFLDSRVANSFSYFIIEKNGLLKEEASAQSFELEKILIKFLGNAILLNKNLIEDLSDD
jgi:transcriptional regulator with XRE-family HTH domain